MIILAIESSAGPASCAVYDDERLLASAFANNGLTHSKTLMPMIENTLSSAGAGYRDIGLVAVSAGPGSFTGLRIGVSIAKGIAWAFDIPCAGVSSLEAMAFGAAHMDTAVCAVMDARREQVYNALFDVGEGSPVRLTEDRALSLDALAAELENSGKEYILVGDGAGLCYNYLKSSKAKVSVAPPGQVFQSAGGVAIAGRRLFGAGGGVAAVELRPRYLRLPQAERERLERLASGR